MLSSIVTASAPSSSKVVAAFLLFGLRNAGTPLEIASTPVSAAQPEENARASRKISAIWRDVAAVPGSGSRSQVGALDVGQVAGERRASAPYSAMPSTPTMKP